MFFENLIMNILWIVAGIFAVGWWKYNSYYLDEEFDEFEDDGNFIIRLILYFILLIGGPFSFILILIYLLKGGYKIRFGLRFKW